MMNHEWIYSAFIGLSFFVSALFSIFSKRITHEKMRVRCAAVLNVLEHFMKIQMKTNTKQMLNQNPWQRYHP